MSSKHQQRILLKQARIKNIPEGWKISTVENACEVKNNLRKPISVNERALIQGKFPYYGPTGILDYINEYQLDGKYALIGEDGDHFLKYQSWSQTQLIQGKFNVNNHAHVIAETKECLVEWFFVYYQHRNILNFVSRQGAGRYKLNKACLFSLPILLPPLDEQKKIAEILGTCDRTLELTEKLITAKRKLKQALMQKLLTGKLRFPEFEGQKWITKKIGSFADVTAGGTPSTTEKSYWGGNIRWMNSGELNLKRVYEVIGRITEDGLKNSSTKLIPANSVLIGLAGQGKTRGTVAVNLVELCTNQSIAAILPNKQFSYWFLYHNLEYRYEELRSLSTGEGGRGGLNLGIIKRIETDFPSIDEQEKIASCLNNLDDEIGILEKQKQLLTKQKKGLMQKLLTGKIRVKTDN